MAGRWDRGLAPAVGGRGPWVICDREGTLICNVAFPDAASAMAWMDAEGAARWSEMARARGLPEAACPTLEWHRTEPPPWSHVGSDAWIGRTGGAEQDEAGLPHVAALALATAR